MPRTSALDAAIHAWLDKAHLFETIGWELCSSLTALVNEHGARIVYPAIIKAATSLKKCTTLTEATLAQMYDCGCHLIPPALVGDTTYGGAMLRRRACAIAEKWLPKEALIPIVITKKNGAYETIYKHYSTLLAHEVKFLESVIDDERNTDLPSVQAQQQALAQKKAQRAGSLNEHREPFTVVNGDDSGYQIYVRRGLRLKRKDIQPLADRMLKALDAAEK